MVRPRIHQLPPHRVRTTYVLRTGQVLPRLPTWDHPPSWVALPDSPASPTWHFRHLTALLLAADKDYYVKSGRLPARQ
jgi:hypothetical protein